MSKKSLDNNINKRVLTYCVVVVFDKPQSCSDVQPFNFRVWFPQSTWSSWPPNGSKSKTAKLVKVLKENQQNTLFVVSFLLFHITTTHDSLILFNRIILLLCNTRRCNSREYFPSRNVARQKCHLLVIFNYAYLCLYLRNYPHAILLRKACGVFFLLGFTICSVGHFVYGRGNYMYVAAVLWQ